jgi:two-component system, OmpR family, phosphate regulon sensor histidine kinase PhoR
MINSTIRGRITAGILIAVLPITGFLGWYLLRWVERSDVETLSNALRAEANMISRLVEQDVVAANAESLSRIVASSSRDLTRRITVVDAKGQVLAESDSDPHEMQSHASRPEIEEALASGTGSAIRYSNTLRQDMLYSAHRIGSVSSPIGVVRLAEPLSEIRSHQVVLRRTFAVAALVATVFIGWIAIWLAGSIARPIGQITAAATRMGKGDISARITFLDKPTDEVFRLAATLNSMSFELSKTLAELREEKAKLEAVFSKSDDAIIVIGAEGQIQMLNPVASQIIAPITEIPAGKTLVEATLSHELAELSERVMSTGTAASLIVSLASANRDVNAYVVPIDISDSVGAVIVMHDLTEAKKIDDMRRDFIANISHELRTPLASIKAMAETILLRGKADDGMVAAYSTNIVAETDRLVRITEDLLDLSSIEAGRRRIIKEDVSVADVTRDAVERLAACWSEKNISVDIADVGNAVAYVDRDSLLQALLNLLSNAITYTPEGGKVSVFSFSSEAGTHITVADTGIGMAPEELPRIFERFYRVDRGRSRASGGTGLGLSIVKHVVDSHGGEVTVESNPGHGTNFTMLFPDGK